MKSYRKELYFNLPVRRGFVNITPQVEEAVRASGVTEGLVLVNAMNITASEFIITLHTVNFTNLYLVDTNNEVD